MTLSILSRRHPPRRGISLWRYLALSRQRRALAQLDPRLLRDVGLSEDAARAEAARRFWDAPHHWFR